MLEHRDGDGLVLQEVKKTGGHAQLIDAVDLVDLSEVPSESESAL